MLRCEAEVATGLKDISRDELRTALGGQASIITEESAAASPGTIPFDYDGDLRDLLRLRTVLQISLVHLFAVPRPRALLGQEHLDVLLDGVAVVRSLHPPNAFATLHLSAAGSESPVMQRLKEEVARRSGLRVAGQTGDLEVRLRRPPNQVAGWEVLIRLSPRPLSTRPWRVCNMEGALNATVAQAMIMLTGPRHGDVFLNLACGSGTFLIERLAYGPASRVMGCDTSPTALACAQANVAAAGLGHKVELQSWDARALSLEGATVDALCADLPFGHLTGSHQENLALYPALIGEAARVAKQGSRFALITYERRLTMSTIRGSDAWEVEQTIPVGLGGIQPIVFLLRRR